MTSISAHTNIHVTAPSLCRTVLFSGLESSSELYRTTQPDSCFALEIPLEPLVPTRTFYGSFQISFCKRQIDRIKFSRLLGEWETQRGFTSSQWEIETCPAHMGILAMGQDAVPLIMGRIEDGEVNHWFRALELITGAQPVRLEDRGNYAEMARAWLEWWKNQN